MPRVVLFSLIHVFQLAKLNKKIHFTSTQNYIATSTSLMKLPKVAWLHLYFCLLELAGEIFSFNSALFYNLKKAEKSLNETALN